ncbi:MAG TPA: hypothetical protein VGM93_03770, partial [Acidimicrobiales bacterium]
MRARLAELVARLPGKAVTIGVLAACGILFGSAWYQAFTTPPYLYTDEQAHAGYVLSVQAGHPLPSIDTPTRQQDGGSDLRLKLSFENAARHDVWVANNPPYPYVLDALPAALTRASGVTGGPLLGDRFTNFLCATIAVALTYALGCELSGGDRRIGLVAAGILAALPHPSFITSLGLTDGIALLAATANLLVLARLCRRGPSRAAVIALGLTCAASAAVRPMNLVLAAACGAIGLALTLKRGTVNRWWAAVWIGVPTLLTSGWFYLLNLHRYGDATASKALFKKFDRVTRVPLSVAWHRADLWAYVVRVLFNRRIERPVRTEQSWWYQDTTILLRVALLGVIILVIVGIRRADLVTRFRRFVDRSGTPAEPLETPAVAWAAMLVLVLANAALLAQFWGGGGSPNARYLLPSVPIVAAAIALVVVSVLGRLGGLAVVLAAGALQLG